MKAIIYNKEGKQAGETTLPEAMFGVAWNADMMHQVIVSEESNARQGTAHTKGRGDVRGGGKKPWRQKGTGRARHGSIRSPIWRGGGITHGPTAAKDYTKKINKTVRRKALFMALSAKVKDGKILFVDEVASTDGKTKGVAQVLKNLEKVEGFKTLTTKKKNNALVLIPEKNEKTIRAFRNIPFAFAESIARANPVEILRYRYVVIANPEASFAALESKLK